MLARARNVPPAPIITCGTKSGVADRLLRSTCACAASAGDSPSSEGGSDADQGIGQPHGAQRQRVDFLDDALGREDQLGTAAAQVDDDGVDRLQVEVAGGAGEGELALPRSAEMTSISSPSRCWTSSRNGRGWPASRTALVAMTSSRSTP